MANVIQLIQQIAMARGARFASFVYTSQPSGARLTAETARYLLILGASTQGLYERDLVALKELATTAIGLDAIACTQLIMSKEKALSQGFDEGPYEHTAVPGIKIHLPTGALHIMGLSERKDTITAGRYRTVNSAPLTLAKQSIARVLPSGRLRQFKLENVRTARLNGVIVEME